MSSLRKGLFGLCLTALALMPLSFTTPVMANSETKATVNTELAWHGHGGWGGGWGYRGWRGGGVYFNVNPGYGYGYYGNPYYNYNYYPYGYYYG